MRKILCGWGVCALVVLAMASPAAAGDDEFTADFMADFERVSGRLVELAEAVPADQFGWAPSEDVRTVSEVYMHVTGVNFLMPGGMGASMPQAEGLEGDNPMAVLGALEANVTDKDDVVAKLKESIEYAKTGIPEVVATGLDEETNLFGFPASKRAYLFILLTHAHEHLGQSIAYARSLGVVPPWTAARQAAQEGGDG